MFSVIFTSFWPIVFAQLPNLPRQFFAICQKYALGETNFTYLAIVIIIIFFKA